MERAARNVPRKPFNILLSEKHAGWLDWLHRHREESKAAIVREALRRMHEQEWSAYARRNPGSDGAQ